MKALPSIERVRELLMYAPDTGEFFWRVGRNFGPAAVRPGELAGTTGPRGYRSLTIDGKKLPAHRVAFACVMGHWPVGDVDHVDGNRSNNRWCNLREATRAQNNQNQRRGHRNSSHGFLGVIRANRPTGVLWMARIQVDGRPKHLGCFKTAELAHARYLEEKRRLHEFAPVAGQEGGPKA